MCSHEWSCSKRLKNIHMDFSTKKTSNNFKKNATFSLGLNRHFFVLMSFFYFLYFCVCPQPFSLHIYPLFVLQMHIIYSLYVSIVAITIWSDWDYIHTSIWLSMSCLILLQGQIGRVGHCVLFRLVRSVLKKNVPFLKRMFRS